LFDFGLFKGTTVHEGTVRSLEVSRYPGASVPLHEEVFARHFTMGNDKICRRTPADDCGVSFIEQKRPSAGFKDYSHFIEAY
jgi:hypothetical protein